MPSLPDDSLHAMSRERVVPAVRARRPLAMAWVLLLASALAILVIGLVATTQIFQNLPESVVPIRPWAWAWFGLACGLTVASLALRTLRWLFLLRRSDIRIPLRDAYIGYLSGLSLLLAPLLVGEIAIRAVVLRARAGVPLETTVLVNLWERLLDIVALAVIFSVFGLAAGVRDAWTWGSLIVACAMLAGPIRAAVLRGAALVARVATRRFSPEGRPRVTRLAASGPWLIALLTSVLAWILSGMAFWLLAGIWEPRLDFSHAERAYAQASGLGGLRLAPGGVLVAGERLLESLEAGGVPAAFAAWSVVAVRLATVGVSTMLGLIFLLIHVRSRAEGGSHFDAIADAYDVQISEGRRLALLGTKTDLMCAIIEREGVGRRGLDVGCGQGAYVARMRELGFDVAGIDDSPGQIERARQNVGPDGIVSLGSVLEISAPDETYDFAYVINVLHHLPSVADQRRAFRELFRVLRPGGLLFVHEINTRNVLFRFYMGYVFPSLNCIDEGVERWLLPHRLQQYTSGQIVTIRYFTFLPDFIPQSVAKTLRPLERLLEASWLAPYSAHYMGVLRKGSDS